MYTEAERSQIAQTIIQQMGGLGKIRAMVNGRDFLILDAGVQFTFSGKRGMNKCLVKLNTQDTYDVEFWYCKLNKKTYEFKSEMKKEYNDVYASMLIDIFESTTGLYLSL